MTCPHCGEPLSQGVNFCEECGRALAANLGASLPQAATPGTQLTGDAADPLSTPTVRHDPGVEPEDDRPGRVCRGCGGVIDADDYCTQCGLKAPSARDHFTRQPADWVAGVCDRGQVHERNEDAMALTARGPMGGRAVLVVCDGVSTSDDSDVASMAAAQAAVEVLSPPMPRGLGVGASVDLAAARVFTQAAQAANAAVIAATSADSPRPASCTFVAAVVEGDTIRYAGLGDSRAYWLPDGQAGQALLVDDSVAQEFIAAGMPREQAEVTPQAHAITKWLGRDSPDVEPRVGVIVVQDPGWLLVCSDGLWNYASEPDLLAHRIEAAGSFDAMAVANSLVDWANSRGGRDNITVTLARLEPPGDNDGPTIPRADQMARSINHEGESDG